MKFLEPNDRQLRARVPNTAWPETRGRVELRPGTVHENFSHGLDEQSRAMMGFARQHHIHGLAANQVGWGPRMFVLSDIYAPTMGFEQDTRRVYINADILTSGGQTAHQERCPNFPGLQVRTKRPRTIEVWAIDVDGEPFTQILHHEAAKAACQAMDSLNGVTIMDHSCFGNRGYTGTTELEARWGAGAACPLSPGDIERVPLGAMSAMFGKAYGGDPTYGRPSVAAAENFAEQWRATHAVNWDMPEVVQQLAHARAVRAVHDAANKVRATMCPSQSRWKRGFRRR